MPVFRINFYYCGRTDDKFNLKIKLIAVIFIASIRASLMRRTYPDPQAPSYLNINQAWCLKIEPYQHTHPKVKELY